MSTERKFIKLLSAEQYDEATKMCFAKVSESPNDFSAWHNLGMCHSFTRRYEESIQAYNKAIHLNPLSWNTHFNLGQIYLLSGDLEKGFALFESRFGGRHRKNRWNGENLSGKTLLVIQSEGYGDAFHCLRYIPCLKKYGCDVLLYLKP